MLSTNYSFWSCLEIKSWHYRVKLVGWKSRLRQIKPCNDHITDQEGSCKGRGHNSLPQTFHKSSHNHPKGSVTQLVIFADVSQNRLCPLPIHYIVIRYPQQMVQMAFYDLSHTYHKHVTNVSPACFCHPTVGNFDVSPKAGAR